jgi:hypothetical protein
LPLHDPLTGQAVAAGISLNRAHNAARRPCIA